MTEVPKDNEEEIQKVLDEVIKVAHYDEFTSSDESLSTLSIRLAFRFRDKTGQFAKVEKGEST